MREYARGLSLGGGIGGILYCKESGSFYYYHYDGSGNVTSVTDGDGLWVHLPWPRRVEDFAELREMRKMRVTATLLVKAILVLAITAGCGHVGRKVDLVSKFGLSATTKIEIDFCDGYDGVPKLVVTDPAVVAAILEDMRQAVGVPRYKWGTIAGANFILKSGEKRELEVFRDYANGNLRLVVRDGRRFWGFGGKLAELIQTHAKPYRE